MKILFLFGLLLFSTTSLSIDAVEFDNPKQLQQFKELTQELRCPVCQNQNLADSGAGLANDLKQEIHQQITEGKTNDEIIDFMVARYGDFIIYRPEMKPLNYLLWFGPLFFLITGFYILYRHLKKPDTLSDLSSKEQEELQEILNKIDNQ